MLSLAVLVLLLAACAPPARADDGSLTPEQYVARGLPDLKKPWAVADYVKAVETLEQISRADYRLLPSPDSPRSQPVWTRLARPDHLAGLKDPARPLAERLAQARDHMRARTIWQSLIVLAHVERMKEDPQAARRPLPSDPEAVLEDLTLAFQMTREAQALPADDEQRMYWESYRRVLVGSRAIDTPVSGIVSALGESHSRKPAELAALVDSLASAIPSLYAGLSPEMRPQIASRLFRSRAEDEKSLPLRDALTRLAATLETIEKNPPPPIATTAPATAPATRPTPRRAPTVP